MADLSVVPLPNKLRQEGIAYLRDLLVRMDAGETVAVTTVEEKPDGTYSIGGTGTLSRLQTAGALLEAAMKRINQ